MINAENSNGTSPSLASEAHGKSRSDTPLLPMNSLNPPATVRSESPALTAPDSPVIHVDSTTHRSPDGCSCSAAPVPPVVYTVNEAAAIFKVSPGTLRRWRRENTGPTYVRVSGRIGYRHEDLTDYLASRLVAPKAA
ncbi:helix-turn-helix domain-containing protein [Kitasatospora griseola]|uniref:helix-turn-helix domain-containing protein n=1 Tax=Kitasatospora griseola TaxID=2064 RepID=UPI0034132301